LNVVELSFFNAPLSLKCPMCEWLSSLFLSPPK